MGTAKSRCWQISSKALKTFSVLLPGPSCRETQEANILLSFLRVPLIRNIKTPLNIFSLYGNRKINKSFDYSFSNEIKQSPNIYFHTAKNINSYKSIFLKEEWSDISERRGKTLYVDYLFCYKTRLWQLRKSQEPINGVITPFMSSYFLFEF